MERAVTEQQDGGYVREIRLHFSVSAKNLVLSGTFIYLIAIFQCRRQICTLTSFLGTRRGRRVRYFTNEQPIPKCCTTKVTVHFYGI